MAQKWVKQVGKTLTQYLLGANADGSKGIRATTVGEYIANNGTEYGIQSGAKHYGPQTLDSGTVASTEAGIVVRIRNDDTDAIDTMDSLVEMGENWLDAFKESEDPVELAQTRVQAKLDRLFKPKTTGDDGTPLPVKDQLAGFGLRGRKFKNLSEDQAQAVLSAVIAKRDEYAAALAPANV